MKKETPYKLLGLKSYVLTLLMFIGTLSYTKTYAFFQEPVQDMLATKVFKGSIFDSNTKEPLAYVDINISDTNIRTITNNEGEFILKVPTIHLNKTIKISLLGYAKGDIAIASLKEDGNKIYLNVSITQLSYVNVYGVKNAEALVKATLNRKRDFYDNEKNKMTAFYRETIKKRHKNASLSEAVLTIYKQPYINFKHDDVSLLKSRKNTDYSKLDTLALKLQGGPFSALYTDMIKYPEYVFDSNNLSDYDFAFDESTQLNNRLVYVVNFKPKVKDNVPLYHGKLYIDSQTLALTSAVYTLNISNRELASKMFVKKKPKKVDVYPTLASYRVDYRARNGKWYYGYGKIELTFKVNWKHKLFNNVYSLNCEMAITDWEVSDETSNTGEKLKPSVILTDKASGFSDPEFWGEYNIIEPEKSIETAIKKIIKQLERAES